MAGPKATAPEIRFARQFVIDDTTDCWVWTGGRLMQGYGCFHIGSRIDGTRRQVKAHRWSYEHHVGPIPDGLQLDHLCRNPPCVNPQHLEPVTPRVNTLRGNTRAAENAAKTHCLRGHPFDEANTYRSGDGMERSCRTCKREQMREYRANRAG